MEWMTIIMWVASLLGTFLLSGLTWLVGKAVIKWGLNENQAKVLESIAISVDRVYQESVRIAKASNSKNKLSDDQRAQFKSMAINYVKEDLAGQELALFNSFGKPKISKLIENAVTKAKKK